MEAEEGVVGTRPRTAHGPRNVLEPCSTSSWTPTEATRGTSPHACVPANKLNARAAIILGDDELAKGVAQVKDLDSGDQREVALDKLGEALRS